MSDYIANTYLLVATVAAITGGIVGSCFSFFLTVAATNVFVDWLHWHMKGLSAHEQQAVITAIFALLMLIGVAWFVVVRWGFAGGLPTRPLSRRQILAAYELRKRTRYGEKIM